MVKGVDAMGAPKLNKTAMLNAELEGTKRDLVQMENKYTIAFLWAIMFGIVAVFALLATLYLLVVKL